MIKTLTSGFRFSASSQILLSLKSDPEYTRKNPTIVVNYLSDLIQMGSWVEIQQMRRHLRLKTIDKWDVFQSLSQPIHAALSSFNEISDLQKFIALEQLRQFQYEPDPEKDYKFYEHVQKNIKKSMQKDSQNQLIHYCIYLLSMKPQMFKPYQKTIEQYFLRQYLAQYAQFLPQMNSFLASGFIADFWSQDLKKKIDKKKINKRMKNYLDFTDLSIPTTIQPSILDQLSATEKKICEFLKDLQYNFKPFQMINGFEIDYLFDDKTIVEYNGTTHYKINQKQPIEGKRSKWKCEMLRKRGFHVITIPFYQWEKLENEKIQKSYLIEKIERSILEKYLNQVK